MEFILGPKSHVSTATLVRPLLAMTMEIWDRECGPFLPIVAVFAILGQVGNAISPWGKEISRKEVGILVAYDRGSIALKFRICSSGLAGVMQITARESRLCLTRSPRKPALVGYPGRPILPIFVS